VKLGWLGGLVATVVVFAIVAPAAMASDFKPGGDKCIAGSCNDTSNTNVGNSGAQNSNNKSLSVSDVVLSVQAQVASQKAHVSQSGIAASGDASSANTGKNDPVAVDLSKQNANGGDTGYNSTDPSSGNANGGNALGIANGGKADSGNATTNTTGGGSGSGAQDTGPANANGGNGG